MDVVFFLYFFFFVLTPHNRSNITCIPLLAEDVVEDPVAKAKAWAESECLSSCGFTICCSRHQASACDFFFFPLFTS
jgi:hypothetical protein